MNRRRYLQALGGVGLVAAAGCNSPDRSETEDAGNTRTTDSVSPQRAENAEREDLETAPMDEDRRAVDRAAFDTVVDMVDDADCDPTGEDACDEQLRSAASDGYLLEFPEGTYRLDEFSRFQDLDRIGIVGDGDVTFAIPAETNRLLFDFDQVGEVLIEGIDIDITADQCTVGLRMMCDAFHVQDVEYVGRGNHDDTSVIDGFGVGIMDENGEGIIRNVTAKKGSIIGNYKGGNGRVGVWTTNSHAGTLWIEDCHFEEFGNNALYCSRCEGDVRVVESYFRNNNVCAIRISGKGSYATRSTIEVDMDEYTGPRGGFETGFNTRAVIVEQGNVGPKPPGAEIRDCEIHIKKTPRCQAAVNLGPQGRTLTVRDTEIRMDVDGSPAVLRSRPGSIPWKQDQRVPPTPHWIALENTAITGSARGGAAVYLVESSNSVIQNCSIDQTGANRYGVRLVNSTNLLIDGGTVTTSQFPILVDSNRLLLLNSVEVTNEPELKATEVDPSQSETFDLRLRQPMLREQHLQMVRLPETQEGRTLIGMFRE